MLDQSKRNTNVHLSESFDKLYYLKGMIGDGKADPI